MPEHSCVVQQMPCWCHYISAQWQVGTTEMLHKILGYLFV